MDAGAIERARRNAFVMTLYERTLSEVRRPLDDDVGTRLRLEHLVIGDAPHPATER